MKEFNFEKLDIYQDALNFVDRIYMATQQFPDREKFGLVDQLRRAATSIPCNIAEGSSRTKRDFVRFLNIALSSTYECLPLLEISRRRGYLDEETFDPLVDDLHMISAKISALKRSLIK
ncbi:MAG: four helix bundle protein [Deltaproteobacteria bacterium]|nr:four helix bundle protein [Deltaproteobacteria bacterium]MBW1929347.1 four helix bundle protein [Deltaproteobacteria bacterium]MBW2025161.1 four helix bundle protein [Deltaproteobacteria bacterium]MBW2125981.1 four helix bundle protein [Deltaproteobacteria bacterium]RLB20714.1 MAG: four helix bundle protein [Deltaproteobacteria bacterium]